MSARPCNREELEALVYGELDAATASEVEAHAADCDECNAELAWLRIERSAMDERAAQQPELPAALWQGIEERIAEPRKGWLYTLFPFRLGGDKARWFGFGLATAAAAAAVLFVVLRAPEQTGNQTVAMVDAGVEREAPPEEPTQEPAPADRMAQAERALDEAEAAHLAAIAALEDAYKERRNSLDPEVAARYDAKLAEIQKAMTGAREAAGNDIDSRMRLLGAYSQQRRALQAVVYGLEEAQ